jgi:hypothetical protein
MSTMTMRSTGNADRFGHSVTLLPGNGQAFVWGGTIATSTGEALEMTAGQLIQPGGTITPVSGVSPRPTAFHTATALGAAEVMIIGGLRTSCIGTLAPCGQNGVTVLPADSPVVRLTVRADGSTDAFAFGSQPFSNSIFHTATRIDEDTLLMTGGSECTVTPTGCEVNTSLTETNRIFAVDISRGAYNDADDEIPAGLLQGRFGHQVTRLDVCPEGTIDCSDPRYLVTGGFVRVPEPAVAIEATRVGEVILMSRGSVGVLEFDEACNFDVGDAGMTDAGADSRVRDSAVDTAVVADTGSPDAATDAAGDGG